MTYYATYIQGRITDCIRVVDRTGKRVGVFSSNRAMMDTLGHDMRYMVRDKVGEPFVLLSCN